MFRPYKVIIRPSKKTDPRAVLCITALWDPKCLQVFVTECKVFNRIHSVTKTCKHLGSHNAVIHNTALGSVFLEGLMMTL